MHDVLVVTEKGNAELHGGGTSLSPVHLLALILVDGRSTAAQIAESAKGLDAALVNEVIGQLLEQRYVAPAKDPNADFIDPDETLNPKAAAGLARGAFVPGYFSLTQHGFHAAIARRAAAERRLAPGTAVQVLAIDEDANVAKFLRTYFDPPKFALKVASDNTQIIEALRQTPLPDVVLADASMPGIEGVVVAMRRHEILARIPVILFAGNDTREAVMQALQSGVNGYMTKPLDMDLLVASVRSVLGLPQEAGASMGFGGVGSGPDFAARSGDGRSIPARIPNRGQSPKT